MHLKAKLHIEGRYKNKHIKNNYNNNNNNLNLNSLLKVIKLN